MPLPDFHRSAPFTLGIELELQVVNPPGYDLSQDSSRLIDDVKSGLSVGEAKHDITESMLEIATGICRDIHQGRDAAGHHPAGGFTRCRPPPSANLRRAAPHPFQTWQRQQISDNPRYLKTVGALRLSGAAGHDIRPARPCWLPERR
ncbi:gamma-glutamyl:cysteine ligase [Raoultella ornithinolytica]|nr:gamma-glutamyl:cysteine ligase [Raoultella ornithinolytica]